MVCARVNGKKPTRAAARATCRRLVDMIIRDSKNWAQPARDRWMLKVVDLEWMIVGDFIDDPTCGKIRYN